MTRAAILLALLSLFTTSLIAGDQPVAYIAEMTGMVCAGCKDHVTASFTKLDGVSKVQIIPGDKPGTQKVTVTSSSSALTKEQAVAALGTSASTYIVHTWKKSEQPAN
ncbi:heavy-metal-associated domain-containing protein [Prosthecobacter sp.]|uniref:heavy-metal-associated domain-containing protein n=1 Tax=Prosthecobacter sp. TaxID=1965333 RepID=UPI001E1810A9|nr:heavy-metal-associated domain-containing protein [Prosthecobacter sp.]MCB1278822.1 cation transporter [Prosthecobacter sp.]